MSESPDLILIAGSYGSGKTTFANIFKHAFLRSLSPNALYQGILGGESFYYETRLDDKSHIDLIKKAKKQGYRITCYYLFSGEKVAKERCRFRALKNKENFDEEAFLDSYPKSSSGLADIYTSCETVFLVQNQKEIRFLGAFEPSKTAKGVFLRSLTKVKDSTEYLNNQY